MSKLLSITTISISTCCLLSGESLKLASNSPFLPPGYSEKKPMPLPEEVQQVNGPLSKDFEFRGIVQLDDIYQFSLFRKSENKAYWISENESENGISISDFDLDSMQITISANGQSEQITLMTASDSPLPVATTPAKPIDMPNQVQPPQISTNAEKKPIPTRRTIPRRRVVLPKK